MVIGTAFDTLLDIDSKHFEENSEISANTMSQIKILDDPTFKIIHWETQRYYMRYEKRIPTVMNAILTCCVHVHVCMCLYPCV